MKRTLASFLSGIALVLLLTGCCLSHEWQEATCTAPRTCAKCQETEGEALGHTWAEATCTEPKTCTVCGATEGDALGHAWTDATCAAPKTCSTCGITEGEPLLHNALAMTVKDGHFTTPCPDCGITPLEKIDWNAYAGQFLAGEFTSFGMMRGNLPSLPPAGDSLSVHEDGTFSMVMLGNKFTGTWVFDQYLFGLLEYQFIIDGTECPVIFAVGVPDMLTFSFGAEDLTILFSRNKA